MLENTMLIKRFFLKIIIIITFIEMSIDILLVLTLNRILSSMKIILA